MNPNPSVLTYCPRRDKDGKDASYSIMIQPRSIDSDEEFIRIAERRHAQWAAQMAEAARLGKGKNDSLSASAKPTLQRQSVPPVKSSLDRSAQAGADATLRKPLRGLFAESPSAVVGQTPAASDLFA